MVFKHIMSKRTLNEFFQPTAPKKKQRLDLTPSEEPPSTHSTYPFPIAQFPPEIVTKLGFSPSSEPEIYTKEPHLDLLYFKPYISSDIADSVFQFLRKELFYYRVLYSIKRGTFTTDIRTPRFTTVFGVDETSCFGENGQVMDARTKATVPKDRYKCAPRPIPGCLEALRAIVEGTTGQTFNFCLVNYYATGDDSISFHSDDEQFLGTKPSIASFSLGVSRDFLMKHRPPKEGQPPIEAKQLKFALQSGDMILMRGPTQSNWLHSIPKRKTGDPGRGRINITFRKALVTGGTENYYRYNVGAGPAYRWNDTKGEMELYEKVKTER
jgi:alkylated DNA repair dioxygenase AlkB